MNLTIFQKGVILTAIPLVSQLIFTIAVIYFNRAATRAQLLAGHDEIIKDWQLMLLLGSSLAASLFTVALALFFSRGIGRRLEMLSQNVQRLAEGKELTAPMDGQDEITALDASFRAMAQKLRSYHEELNRSTASARQLNEELEDRVIVRTKELAEANRDLSQKNQEVEMFVYSVSHDLRSPLVNLEGFSKELSLSGEELRQLLSDEQVPSAIRTQALKLFDESMSESIYFIQTAVRRLSRIIDALLRLSRAGRVEYQLQQVDMGNLLERIVASLHNTIAQRQAKVVVQPLAPAFGDPTALEQVFANLVGNALNYLDPKRPGVVEIGMTKGNGDGATFFVKDNGLGIPEAHQRKMFQAFQRAHPDRAPGEGIGLTIVRRIVERHRGRVWMESRHQEGTTFFVTLPEKTFTA